MDDGGPSRLLLPPPRGASRLSIPAVPELWAQRPQERPPPPGEGPQPPRPGEPKEPDAEAEDGFLCVHWNRLDRREEFILRNKGLK